MRKNFGPQTWIVPMPVFIIGTYDKDGKPNAMNAAWGGTYDTNMVYVCLSDHKTTDNLKVNKAFTIGFADAKNMVGSDYVGLVSGRKVLDKFDRAGFSATKSQYVNAPVINEMALTIECEMVSFNDGCLVGKIVNVSADESILGEDGKPDITLMEPISYDPVHHKYLKVSTVVGNAFSEGKKLIK